MAVMPCMICEQRFKGEACNVFAQSYDGDEREAYRLIVCSGCRTEVLDVFRSRALYRDDDGDWAMPEAGQQPIARFQPQESREKPPRGAWRPQR